MWAQNDLLNDILPMVIEGILDPAYITGEVAEEEEEEEEEKGRDPEEGEKKP